MLSVSKAWRHFRELVLMFALKTIFVALISLLFIHEMDAIRNKEWEMIPLLNRMDDNEAYQVFLLAHLPLFLIVLSLLALSSGSVQTFFFYIFDGMLILHTFVHFIFRNHYLNRFKRNSYRIMYGIGGIAVIHLGLTLLLNS
ncbi:MAG: hypothetical protein FWH42_01110 [Dehalococcoidia bacterium]|nr:hypothetical protein [Dehalococcoidia bacterium]